MREFRLIVCGMAGIIVAYILLFISTPTQQTVENGILCVGVYAILSGLRSWLDWRRDMNL